MFDLENEIQHWIRGLRRNAGFEDGDVEEIEIHIRDSIEADLDRGLSEREAFEKAVSSFGRLDDMGNELIKSRTLKMKLPKRDFLAHNDIIPDNPVSSSLVIFSNYLKGALRTIRRNKGISILNLIGMSLGFASVIIISNWAQYEFSFDRFHKNRDRIYRVIEKQEFQGQDLQYLSSMPEWLTGTFEKEIPGVVASTGLLNCGSLWFGSKDSLFEVKNTTYTNNNFFRIFSLDFIYGDPKTALQEPSTMVLTESLSGRLFGDRSPVGKTVRYKNGHLFTVTGMIKDIPDNSHFQADAFLSMKDRMPDWDRENYDHTTSIYLLLDAHTDPASLSGPLHEFVMIHMPGNAKFIEIQAQPLKDIHLHSKNTIWGQNWKKSEITWVLVLLMVGLLVIVISAINYINFSVSLINQRFVEFGMRKIAGSSRTTMVVQYFSESFIFLFISFFLAVSLTGIIQPLLVRFHILNNENHLYYQPWFYLAATGFIVFLSLLICIYPAFLLGSAKILDLLHRKSDMIALGFPLGKVLIVAQLAISCTLIIYVGYMLKQIDYMNKKDLGYDQEAILSFEVDDSLASDFKTLRADILAYPNFLDATASNRSLGRSTWRTCIHFEGEPAGDQWTVPYMIVEDNFLDFYQIRIVNGRDFSPEYALDRNHRAFIVSESLAIGIGRDSIIGLRFRTCESEWGEIVGVVHDFNYNSLHYSVEPLAIQLGNDYKNVISVKLRPGDTKASIVLLENIWRRYQPGQPFQYSFLNNKLKNLYLSEQRLVMIHSIFSFISILLSCVGILGVFITTTELRTKEVGLRKVHGATSLDILLLLARGVSGKVLWGFAVAVPVSWFVIRLWKNNFAYTTGISWWIFGLSGAIVLLLAWSTVCFAAINASLRNPVEALRYE
jgi:putative ABC transport system permease protein